jgi:hypothetical protein
MAEKKIIDVTSAVDSKVDIGSKPMIIGHKSMATDPMVREKKDEELVSTENTPKDVQEKTPESKSEIEPPSAKQKVVEPLADSNTEEQVDVDDKSVSSKPDSEPDKKEEESSGEENKTEELDPVALQMEKDEKIRELISSKKYFVGIKQASSGGFKKWIYAFLLTMLLAIAGLFVLVDTGTLDLGVKLPFTIFGDEKSTNSNVDNLSEQQEEKPEEPLTANVSDIVTEPVVEETIELKKITEADILLSKVGDESNLPSVTPVSFVDFISSKLKTFECSLEGSGYTIKKISDEFVSGIVFCDDGYFTYWYLKDGVWLEYSEDVWDCNKVQTIGIPVEFMPTCTDTVTGQEIINPNGSINKS